MPRRYESETSAVPTHDETRAAPAHDLHDVNGADEHGRAQPSYRPNALWQRLLYDLLRDNYQVDDKTLLKLSLCADRLPPGQVRALVSGSLMEGVYEHCNGRVIGTLVRFASADTANAIAGILDYAESKFPTWKTSWPERDRDREARSELLSDVVETIGNAQAEVWKPFLERLRSDLYAVDGPSVRMAIHGLRQDLRDEICTALLARKDECAPGYPDWRMAHQMSLVLRYFSPEVQKGLFKEVARIHEALPLDLRSKMAFCFKVWESRFNDGFLGLPAEQRQEWASLIRDDVNEPIPNIVRDGVRLPPAAHAASSG